MMYKKWVLVCLLATACFESKAKTGESCTSDEECAGDDVCLPCGDFLEGGNQVCGDGNWLITIQSTQSLHYIRDYCVRIGAVPGCSAWIEVEQRCRDEPTDEPTGGLCSYTTPFEDYAGSGIVCTQAPCEEVAGSTNPYSPGTCSTSNVKYCCAIDNIEVVVYDGCTTSRCEPYENWRSECEDVQGGTSFVGNCN